MFWRPSGLSTTAHAEVADLHGLALDEEEPQARRRSLRVIDHAWRALAEFFWTRAKASGCSTIWQSAEINL
jgi:hypothetical protein